MNRWNGMRTLAGTLLVLGVMRTESALACAACYGQSDSPLAQGMNWGIVSLLAVVGCVLSGVAAFFVHIGRKSIAANRDTTTPAEPPAPKH